MPAVETYPLNMFSDEEALEDDKHHLRSNTRAILRLLWQNWDVAWPESVFDSKFLKLLWQNHNILPTFYNALLVEKNPFVLRVTRDEIQKMLLNLSTRLEKDPPKKEKHVQKVRLAIHNILSIYSMFSPSPQQTLTVPVLIDGQWQRVSYDIDPIEITPQSGVMVSFIKEDDRLFSMGLSPTQGSEEQLVAQGLSINAQQKAPSMLVHCGTGWPTAQGAITQYLADLWPGKTPGEIFLDWSGERIALWLRKQKNKTITCGQSLGGALAMLTAMHSPDQILEAHCLNPPGLYQDYDKDHPLLGAWEATPKEERPTVYIQKQVNDPISEFGVFKHDFKGIAISINKDLGTTAWMINRAFGAHARNFASCDTAEFDEIDMKQENQSLIRKHANLHLYHRARWVIFSCQLAPYFFFYRPIKDFIIRNKGVVFPFLCFLTFFLLTGGIAPAATAGIVASKNILFNTLLGSLALAKVCESVVSHTYDFLFNHQRRLKGYLSALYQRGLMLASLSLIYDSVNLISLGILHMGVLTLKKLFIDVPKSFVQTRKTSPEIHSKSFLEKTNDLDQYQPPGLGTKITVAALVCLFYVTVFPLKLALYMIPCFILYDLPKKLFCCFKPDMSEDEAKSLDATSERVRETRPPSSPSGGQTHYGPLFKPAQMALHQTTDAKVKSPNP